MYIEADNVQIVALAEYFKVMITIVTLDASANLNEKEICNIIKSETIVETKETVNVQMFFKPGHYDLIYH